MKKLLKHFTYAFLISGLAIQPMHASNNSLDSLLTTTINSNWTNALLIGMNAGSYGLTYKQGYKIRKPDAINLSTWLATATLLASYGNFSPKTKTTLKTISLTANTLSWFVHRYNLNNPHDDIPSYSNVISDPTIHAKQIDPSPATPEELPVLKPISQSRPISSAEQGAFNRNMHAAVMPLTEDAILTCIQNGADILSSYSNQSTILHKIAKFQTHTRVTTLFNDILQNVDKGTLIKALQIQDYQGNTPLMIAAQVSNLTLVEEILKYVQPTKDQHLQILNHLIDSEQTTINSRIFAAIALTNKSNMQNNMSDFIIQASKKAKIDILQFLINDNSLHNHHNYIIAPETLYNALKFERTPKKINDIIITTFANKINSCPLSAHKCIEYIILSDNNSINIDPYLKIIAALNFNPNALNDQGNTLLHEIITKTQTTENVVFRANTTDVEYIEHKKTLSDQQNQLIKALRTKGASIDIENNQRQTVRKLAESLRINLSETEPR